MPIRTILACLLAMMLLAGCGGGNRGEQVPVSGATNSAKRQVTSTGQYQSLQFTFSMPAEAPADQPVPMTLTVTNTGEKAVSYTPFHYLDFSISQDGQVIHQLSQAFGIVDNPPSVIQPGEVQTFEQNALNRTFENGHTPIQVPPGTYVVKAWFSAAIIDGEYFLPGEPEQRLSVEPVQITIR